MAWSAERIIDQVVRILEQGAAGVSLVVDAYLEKRTPERDMNWLCIQMGKEFGAMLLHADRGKEAVLQGKDGREMDEYFQTIKEEMEHTQAYMALINRTIGVNQELPIPDVYGYIPLNLVNPGMRETEKMKRCRERWPDNYHYLETSFTAPKRLHPWAARVVSATMEGGAAGWHWAMSKLPHEDEFLAQAAKLQRGIAIDELHHGPQELREIAADYSPDMEIDLDEFFRLMRELRYLEVRQRNEQFLHPLSEEELQGIRTAIMDDTMQPVGIYAQAA